MSWVLDKATIKNVLTNLGYEEIAIDEDVEEDPFAPQQHKHFKLKKVGYDGLGLTSNAGAFTHKILLECYYINNNDNTIDQNADLFSQTVQGIIGLAGFHGEITSEIQDINEDQIKGVFNFLYGFESC